jgi:hypothetical protein
MQTPSQTTYPDGHVPAVPLELAAPVLAATAEPLGLPAALIVPGTAPLEPGLAPVAFGPSTVRELEGPVEASGPAVAAAPKDPWLQPVAAVTAQTAPMIHRPLSMGLSFSTP